jgi:two-component system sensor histidine kinase/response regulator
VGDKRTILYIEDDPGSLALVQRALSYAGYRVITATRGIEGLDAAKREMPDLILMDINLPDLSGREVTTKLRSDARFRSLPIIALTALSQAGEREKTIAAGATGYLTKPIDVDKLPEQVATYLAGARDTMDTDSLMQAHSAYNQDLVNRLEMKIRELETRNEELRRLDKIKDDFIQLTAHELRTPLTLVYGYSRLLQESAIVRRLKEESAEIRTFIDGLVESIERMSSVINEVLTISRIATGRIELSVGPTNLAEIAGQIVTQFAQAAQQRNLLISFDVTQWPTFIQADGDLLELALYNVVGNAIKYTPDGGVVTLNCKPNSTTVLVTVKDTGIGISKEEQTRIFDRFYTAGDTQLHSTSKTAYRGGGLGLGLAICRGVIEAHGGRIWVESEGRDEEKLPGSTFYVELPLQARTSSPRRMLAT